MIGLMFLAGIAVWLVGVSYLSKWILDFLDPKWRKAPVRALFFVVLLILPMVDEIIGRWQFNRLCEREAVVWLSPDWQKVTRAKRGPSKDESVSWTVIPITKTVGEYLDMDTSRPFFSSTSFYTRGGFLMRWISWEGGSSCRPSNRTEISKEIRIDSLLERGSTQ